MSSRHAHRSCMVLKVGLAAGLAIGLGACAKQDLLGLKDGFGSPKGEIVEASDFASQAAPVQRPVAAPRHATPSGVSGAPVDRQDVFAIGGVRSTGAATIASDPAMEAAPELITSVGSPKLDDTAPARGGAATIDAVVGQINGRPVFMSEVLEPLDGKLRAIAREVKGNAAVWNQAATVTIEGELKRLIEDELILSEARASLTPEQKAGLFRFIKQIEGNLVSSQQGSEVGTDEKLREETGRGLRQEAENIKDRALITNELRNKVTPRVMVPWRDVKTQYEREANKYNPPAKYTFRMVYATGDNSSAVEQIQSSLAAGKGFEEIARLDANEFNRREGGVMERSCAEAQSECTFSPVPELNTALRTLGVGQTLGPIIYAPNKDRSDSVRIAWVYLEKIERPEPTSLYDAQLDIAAELRVERSNAEVNRYFERLRKRGNVSKVEVMRDKLLAVATDRYAPQFAKK